MTARTVRTFAGVVGVPVLVGVTAWAVARGFADELPDPVATHWGPSGAPDGFTPVETALWEAPALAVGFALIVGLVVWAASRRAPQLRRGAGALAGFMSGLIATLGATSLWVQRGLTDARQADDVGGPIAISLVVGIALAAVGAALTPGEVPGAARASGPVPSEATRVALAPSERAAWSGWARSRAVLAVAVLSAALPLLLLAALGYSTLPILLVVGLSAVLLALLSTFRVVVGAGGLVVRSVAGWPRWRVPLEEVSQARAVDVRPMRDFGGWGVRANTRGQFGVVLRAGEALEVTRGDGSRFVVTVDDAASAASLLNTLADRDRDRTPPPGNPVDQ